MEPNAINKEVQNLLKELNIDVTKKKEKATL